VHLPDALRDDQHILRLRYANRSYAFWSKQRPCRWHESLRKGL
jgi:hypothetical protein